MSNTISLGSWDHMNVPAIWHLIPFSGFKHTHTEFTDGPRAAAVTSVAIAGIIAFSNAA